MSAPGNRYPGTGASSLGAPFGAASTERLAFDAVAVEQLSRASYGARVGAAVIDLAILCVPFVAAIAIVFAGPQRTATCISTALDGTRTSEPCTVPTASALAFAGALAIAGAIFVAWYLVLRPGRHGSETVGKRRRGITVVDATTLRPVGPGVRARRELVRIGGVVVTLGFFAVYDHLRPLWHEHGQSVHDQAAGTVVIPTPTSRS